MKHENDGWALCPERETPMNARLLPLLFIGILLAGCHPTPEESQQATPYELPTPLFFPAKNNIPVDNPMTEEGIALGKKLFHDQN